VTAIQSSGLGNLTVTGIGATTAIGVKDVAFAAGTATVTASGARSVNVSGVTQTKGGVTIDVQGASTAVGASLSIVNTGTAATINTLKFGSTTAATPITTAISANATAAITIGTLTSGIANELKTITVTGGSTFTVTNAIASNALTTVDASGNAGGVTLSVDATALTSLKGGSGADTFTTANTILGTAVIDLGAGNDKLVLGGAPTAGAVINGGDGTDTLSISTSAAFNATTKGAISNFEIIDLSGTGQTYDVTQFTGFSGGVTLSGGTLTLSNVAANSTFGVTGGSTVTSLAVGLASTAGTADNVNITLGTAAKGIGTVTAYGAANVETLTINSINGTAAGATTQAVNKLTLDGTNNTLNKIVVTGAGQVEVGVNAATLALSVDASANTAGIKISGAPAVKLDIVGTAVNDTIASGTAGGIINAGKGGDSITLGAGADTVFLKVGDSVYDSTNITTGTTGLAQKGTMDVIAAFTAGSDKIDLSGISGFVGTQQGIATATVADTTALTTLLSTTNFKDGAVIQRGVLDVTVGATHFLVIDADHNGAYSATGDVVVALTGLTGTLTATDFNFGS
jgi:hypothetical protein